MCALLFLKFHLRVFFTLARTLAVYRIARRFQSRSRVTAIPLLPPSLYPPKIPSSCRERSFALYSSRIARGRWFTNVHSAEGYGMWYPGPPRVCSRRYNNRLYALLFVLGFMHIIWASGRRRCTDVPRRKARRSLPTLPSLCLDDYCANLARWKRRRITRYRCYSLARFARRTVADL